MKKSLKLPLLAAVAVTVGLLSSSCLVVGDAMVRFTWESTQTRYLLMIAASYEDVKDWYDDVWFKYYPNVPEEASHTPKWDGSTDIRESIYSKTINSTVNKGRYFSISEGKYTAICSVIDPDYLDTFDIVANYSIEEYLYSGGDPATRYYEIAFDVRRFLDGGARPSSFWTQREYDNPNTRPWLSKTPASGPLLATFTENNVTYTVYRRPKN